MLDDVLEKYYIYYINLRKAIKMNKLLIALITTMALANVANASQFSKRLGVCQGIALQNSIPPQDLPSNPLKVQNQINIARYLQQVTVSARIFDQTNQQDFNDYLIGKDIGFQAASFNGSAPAKTGNGNVIMDACVREFIR